MEQNGEPKNSSTEVGAHYFLTKVQKKFESSMKVFFFQQIILGQFDALSKIAKSPQTAYHMYNCQLYYCTHYWKKNETVPS